jgi:V/A-type H+-transporting ATPase subunit A
VNDAFLRQSAFSEIDRVCSPARQAAMMRLLAKIVGEAQAAVDAGVHPDELRAMPSLRALIRMGEEIGDADLARFAELEARLDRELAAIVHAKETDHAAVG